MCHTQNECDLTGLVNSMMSVYSFYLYRRELDLNRGLDRYECVIVQSEPLEPDSIDLVEAAAAVFERTSPLVVGVTINTSCMLLLIYYASHSMCTTVYYYNACVEE